MEVSCVTGFTDLSQLLVIWKRELTVFTLGTYVCHSFVFTLVDARASSVPQTLHSPSPKRHHSRSCEQIVTTVVVRSDFHVTIIAPASTVTETPTVTARIHHINGSAIDVRSGHHVGFPLVIDTRYDSPEHDLEPARDWERWNHKYKTVNGWLKGDSGEVRHMAREIDIGKGTSANYSG
ncbi:hypothetical protein V8E53_008076 [Lactarius tabidus]